MNRRDLLLGSGLLAATSVLGIGRAVGNVRTPIAPASAPARRFDFLYKKLLRDPKLLDLTRGLREREPEDTGDPSAPKRIVGRPPLSSTPVAQRAIDLMIAFEVTSQSTYTRLYQRPTWPKGASGVTIGIGYDIGYATRAHLTEDWIGKIPDPIIQRFAAACGVTGEAAHSTVPELRDISINWQTANDQFLKRVLPRAVGEAERSLPNTDLLSAEALGALVSLIYNRGASFNSPKDRFREMRAIKVHMEAKAFPNIPDEIRAMKRIWENDPDMLGLLERRELEALLFEDGLRKRAARSRSKKI